MQLLTKSLLKELPVLYSQEKISNEKKMVHAKFFFPMGSWTWFVMEGERKDGDFIFFGYIIGLVERFGYFTLSDLKSISISGLTIERDLYFQPALFGKVMEEFRYERQA